MNTFTDPTGPTAGDWFAVFSKPRREMEAVEQLTRQDLTVFLPQVRVQRRVRGQWRAVIEPMFPRYLFLRAVLGQDDLRPVRSTRGVVGLIRFGGELRPVPEAVIIELRRICAEGVLDLPSPLIPGSQVRILSGPFAGHEAELLHTDGHHRAQVLLKLLGRLNTLTLTLDALAPAENR